MDSKKFSYPPLQIGTSFMLLLFIILCMVTFSVLSLSNALKDYQYSQKNAQRATSYYKACNQAEEHLATIDASLINHSSQKEFIEFTIPMNDTESLQVVLQVHPSESSRYSILTWKQISVKEWSGNQTLPVLGVE